MNEECWRMNDEWSRMQRMNIEEWIMKNEWWMLKECKGRILKNEWEMLKEKNVKEEYWRMSEKC